MGKRKNSKRALAAFLLMLLAVFVLFTFKGRELSTGTGYLVGTQGLQAEFHSVWYNGAWWSSTEQPQGVNPSSASFGYTMVFDPDAAASFKPDLCASQQPITVKDDQPREYTWQYKVESGKTLANGTIVDVYKQFTLFRYKCEWAVNVWLSGTEAEALGRERVVVGDRELDPTYSDAAIWLKLTPRSFVYFLDNPDQVYFAPCYVGLAKDVEWIGTDKNGQKILNDGDIEKTEDIIPEAQGETLGIYYQRGGGSVVTEDTFLQYQGTRLDPEIFRDQYWIRFSLIQFKPYNWWDLGFWHNWKFPSAHLDFLVYVFVVGEWTVMLKTGEVPQLEPHTPVSGGENPFQWIIDWFANPWNQLWTLLIIAVVVIVVVSVTSPGIWLALAKRNGGERKNA